MAYGGGHMGVFVVFATDDLRARVASTCRAFYMPFAHFAVVSYNGSAEELARRLNVDRSAGPGAVARCLDSKRMVAMAVGGVLILASAIRLFELLT